MVTTAVIYDHDQAEQFVPLHGDMRILSLTPAAAAILIKRGFAVQDSAETYSDSDQDEQALTAGRLRDRLRAGAGGKLGPYAAASQKLVDLAISLYQPAARLWVTMGETGPWQVLQGGEWRIVTERRQAFAALLRSILPDGPYPVHHFASYRGVWIVKLLQYLLLLRARRTRKWAVINRPRMQFGFSSVFKEAGDAGLCTPTPPVSLLSDVFLTLRQLVAPRLDSRIQFIAGLANPDRDRNTDGVIAPLLAEIDDPALQAALTVHGARVRNQVLGYARAEDDVTRLIAQLRPYIALSYQINNQLAAAIWAAAYKAGVKRVIFHHNSLCDAGAASPASDTSMALTTERHYSTIPADIYLAWSPVHQDCLKRYLPDSRQNIQSFRIEPPPHAVMPAGRKFTILYADNYMEWHSHLPSLMQSSDELWRSIQSFCRALRHRNDIEIVIRLKPKGELHPGIAELLQQDHPNVSISDYNVPFRQELMRSDLVVGTLSTTLEEALNYRTPILMFGYQTRYPHLPQYGMRNGRGPVYRAMSEGEIESLVDRIRRDHTTPLTDQEVTGLCWPRETPVPSELTEIFEAAE